MSSQLRRGRSGRLRCAMALFSSDIGVYPFPTRRRLLGPLAGHIAYHAQAWWLVPYLSASPKWTRLQLLGQTFEDSNFLAKGQRFFA